MANEPYGDIEILMSAPNNCVDVDKSSQRSRLRIRLRQGRRELEISKSIYRGTSQKSSGRSQQSAWSKKVFPIAYAGFRADMLKDIPLAEDETMGALLLQQFLVTCQAVKSARSNSQLVQLGPEIHKSQGTSTKQEGDDTRTSSRHGKSGFCATSAPRSNCCERTCATAGSSVSVTNDGHIANLAKTYAFRSALPPRPHKFSRRSTAGASSDSDVDEPETHRGGHDRRLSDAGSDLAPARMVLPYATSSGKLL